MKDLSLGFKLFDFNPLASFWFKILELGSEHKSRLVHLCWYCIQILQQELLFKTLSRLPDVQSQEESNIWCASILYCGKGDSSQPGRAGYWCRFWNSRIYDIQTRNIAGQGRWPRRTDHCGGSGRPVDTFWLWLPSWVLLATISGIFWSRLFDRDGVYLSIYLSIFGIN